MLIMPDYLNDNTELKPFSPALDPPKGWGRATCGPAMPRISPACTCRQHIATPIRHSYLHLREDIGKVWWHAHDIYFTTSELRMLRLLFANRDAFITYRAIYDVIQSPGFIAGDGHNGWQGNVRSAIKRVRKKFLAVDPLFNCIINQQAFGYAWIEADPIINYAPGVNQEGEVK